MATRKKCKYLDEDGVCPLHGRCYHDDPENCRDFKLAPLPPKAKTVAEAEAEGQPDLFK